jgi:ArsR family transcriptional regulator, arsenate/arsenite/antimonite-responsive transcriptional repressor
MDTTTALNALKSIAQESRLAAFRLLVQAGPAGLSVGELRDALAIPPATLTAHLNQLRGAGLVLDTRSGRRISVRADYARMDALIGFLTQNCCAGQANAQCLVGALSASCAGKPVETKSNHTESAV